MNRRATATVAMATLAALLAWGKCRPALASGRGVGSTGIITGCYGHCGSFAPGWGSGLPAAGFRFNRGVGYNRGYPYYGTGGFYLPYPYYYGAPGYFMSNYPPDDYGSGMPPPAPPAAPTGWPNGPGAAPHELVPAAQANVATITIQVPTPDADVWIEGTKMRQKGTIRRFITPSLTPGAIYSYEIRAAWSANGRTVGDTQRLSVQAGDRPSLVFLTGSPVAAEKVKAPPNEAASAGSAARK